MNQSDWKGRERKTADFFGGERTPLSGMNSKHTGADVIHDELFIEHKQRKSHAVIRLWDKTKALATKEEKIPVVTLSEKGRPGFWVLVKEKDLVAVANQRQRVKHGGGS